MGGLSSPRQIAQMGKNILLQQTLMVSYSNKQVVVVVQFFLSKNPLETCLHLLIRHPSSSTCSHSADPTAVRAVYLSWHMNGDGRVAQMQRNQRPLLPTAPRFLYLPKTHEFQELRASNHFSIFQLQPVTSSSHTPSI